MKIIKDGFWDYVNRWQKEFHDQRKVWWNKNWIENDYCADCRFCCGPQTSAHPFPMPLLPRQICHKERERFHLLDAFTPYLAEQGCKSDSPHGCRLQLEDKPVACGLFPIVLINGSLWLYQNCPAVVFNPIFLFMQLAKNAAAMLMEFSYEELLHLSLWLTNDILARSYVDLRIQIFDKTAKNLLFL